MSVLYDFVCWICVGVALSGPYWFWDFDGDDVVGSWKTVIL